MIYKQKKKKKTPAKVNLSKPEHIKRACFVWGRCCLT